MDTSERRRVPCMMLENWSFHRDNLAVLRMIREGLFGVAPGAAIAFPTRPEDSADAVARWLAAEGRAV